MLLTIQSPPRRVSMLNKNRSRALDTNKLSATLSAAKLNDVAFPIPGQEIIEGRDHKQFGACGFSIRLLVRNRCLSDDGIGNETA